MKFYNIGQWSRFGMILMINHRYSWQIARRASDIMNQANSDKQNWIVEDLTLFQARKQMFLKQFLDETLVFIFLYFWLSE